MTMKFTAVDPFGTPVVCPLRTWTDHIVGGHPEMEGREALAQQAIEHPFLINQSDQHANRKVF